MSVEPSSLTAETARPRAQPDPARRMLLTTIAITGVVALSVGVWRFATRTSDPDEEPIDDWEAIVLVDRSTGTFALAERDGTLGASETGTGRVTSLIAVGNATAIVRDAELSVITLDGGSRVVTRVPLERDATVWRLPIADRLVIGIGHPNGGEITIVDGRNVVGIGEAAGQDQPLLFTQFLRHNAAGSRFAVADAANFQTIVVETYPVADDDGSDASADGNTATFDPVASFLPIQPVAINDDFALTSQVVGQQAEVTLHDRQGTKLATVTTELPAGGYIEDDGTAIVVSTEGTIYRFTRDDEQPTRVGVVTLPAGATVTGVHPVDGGERLAVLADLAEVIVEPDGTTVHSTVFESTVTPLPPDPAWRCVPIGGGSMYVALVAAETGEQLVDLNGLVVTGTSADGCTVLGTRDGITEVVNAERTVSLGRLRTAAVAPDGKSVVVQTTDGTTQLQRLDASEPVIDLATSPHVRYAIAFIDR